MKIVITKHVRKKIHRLVRLVSRSKGLKRNTYQVSKEKKRAELDVSAKGMKRHLCEEFSSGHIDEAWLDTLINAHAQELKQETSNVDTVEE